METRNNKGQVTVELAVCALILVAMFLIVISLSKLVLNEQKTTRFGESKGERWTKKR